MDDTRGDSLALKGKGCKVEQDNRPMVQRFLACVREKVVTKGDA